MMRGLFFLAIAFVTPVLHAEPFRPQNDSEVLEQLPAGLRGNTLRALPQLAIQANPTIAVTLARGYIERSRVEADPRLLGYAQGLLMPWWNANDPPSEILLLRATIRQARHEFDIALKDLDAVIVQHPDSAQAWLTRATVLRVQGRYTQAAEACARLNGITDPFTAKLCSESVRGVSGDLEVSLKNILEMKPQLAQQSPGVRAWFNAELGDMFERAGKRKDADQTYQNALMQFPDDLSLRAAYADFLLDDARWQDALTLAQGHERVDALRLRELLARVRLRQPHADIEASIASAFDAAHLRNEDLHLREEARFVLDVKHDAPRALALAQRNWAVQHESWDVRLLLAAALAADKPEAAKPALDWLNESKLQDVRITALRTQLEAR